MKYIGSIFILACAAIAVACTSSNTATSSLQTNQGWDQQYRQESRTAQNQQQGQTGAEVPRENPPITIMLVGMETGDVYPGDDYYVYAVVDNPDKRDLEYEWSIADGDVAEVPESERGRLATLVETEYANASATPPAPTEQPAPAAEGQPAPAEGATGVPGTPQPAPGGVQPGVTQTQVPQGGGGPGTSTTQPGQTTTTTQAPPEGSQLPGAQQPGGTQDTYQPLGPSTGGGGGVGVTPASSSEGQPTGSSEQEPSTQPPDQQGLERPAPPPAANPANQDRLDEVWNQLQDIEDQIKLITNEKAQAQMGGDQARVDELDMQLSELNRSREPLMDELSTLQGKTQSDVSSLPPSQMLGYVLERRVVSGANGDDEDDENTDDNSENVELLAEQLAQGVTAVGAGIASEEEGPEGTAGNVASSEAAPESKTWVGSSLDLDSNRSTSLRSQYQTWKDDSQEPRRRNLGGYGDLEETEPLSADESYDVHTFTTAEPYIQWTPQLPGTVNIYVKATYKGEDMTDPRELDVQVRLRDPDVEISQDFPDVVHEDQPLYVMLKGSNIPTFYKGLFTLTFDPNKLSFRDAELGEYFDDAPDASLFYAEPDKMAGKVLLAVDSNLKVGELGGNGPMVYVKFTAKQDLTDRADTQLAMVMDTSARYILDRNGKNVLPLPVETTPFRTETVMPAQLGEYQPEERPGTGGGQVPALGQQQLPGQQGGQQQLPPQQTRAPGGTNVGPTTTGGASSTTTTTGGTNQPQPSGSTQQPNLGKPGGQGTGAEVPTTGGTGGSNNSGQTGTETPPTNTGQQNQDQQVPTGELPSAAGKVSGQAGDQTEAEGTEGDTSSTDEAEGTTDESATEDESASEDQTEQSESSDSEDTSSDTSTESDSNSDSSDSTSSSDSKDK